MELTVEYIPALIVAKNEEGKYIKISESNNDDIYYCPVCNGVVKPRAKNSDKVQPHYYHTTETNCSNESILHWMFKNWLFEEGSKFIIDKNIYSVKSFEIEKSFDTPFGNYVPDLTIETNNETMFFEINYSSGKDKTFSDKWIYLGNKVIEINVKELINSELYETTPIFTTIFKNGEYTKDYKVYEKRDKYLEFKNYVVDGQKEEQIKLIAEKFDWFWREIKSESDEDILLCLDNMEYKDATNCSKFLKKIKCHDKFKICQKQMLTKAYKEMKNIINDDDYFVDIDKVSAQIYELFIYQVIEGVKISCDTYKIRTFDGIISYDDLKMAYDKTFELIKEKADNVKKEIDEINKIKIKGIKLENIEKIINISNRSGYCGRKYEVNLIINIFSEVTDKWERVNNNLYRNNKDVINNASCKLSEIEHDFLEEKRKDDLCKYWDTEGREIIEKELLKISDDIAFISCDKHAKAMKNDLILANFNIEVMNLDYFIKKTNESLEKYKFLNDVKDKINNCKNNFWKAELYGCDELSICIKGLNEECNHGWETTYYFNKKEKFFEDLIISMYSIMNPMEDMYARYSWFKEKNLNYITINTERNGLHEQK